ncbi:MAG: SprT family zinc-dependent metalloprotease [Methylomonas sp.]
MQYTLRRSSRAKYLRIVIKPGGMEVVAPLNISEKRIHSFVASQQEWIIAASIRVRDRLKNLPVFTPPFYADGATIPFQGGQAPLRVTQLAGKTSRVQFHPQQGFTVNLPAGAVAADHSELIRQALIRWMKQQARLQAGQLIAKHADRLNLFPSGLKIKTLKSRWGSCGPENNININWLLLLAPPAAFEYVVIHELCHIKHKNHSADFWNLVAAYCPDYPLQRKWLKQHGAAVMKGL